MAWILDTTWYLLYSRCIPSDTSIFMSSKDWFENGETCSNVCGYSFVQFQCSPISTKFFVYTTKLVFRYQIYDDTYVINKYRNEDNASSLFNYGNWKCILVDWVCRSFQLCSLIAIVQTVNPSPISSFINMFRYIAYDVYYSFLTKSHTNHV